MFKRPSVHYGRMPEPVTPYQKAAQVWDERIGSARVQAKNWRLMAFGCLMLSAGLAAGLSGSPRRDRSRLGWSRSIVWARPKAVAPANTFYQPTDAQIAYHLARFIEDVRGLPADGIVLRQNWLRAYDFTTDRGAAALNDYARNNDPFAKLGKAQISVDVSSVIRASPDSFRVAWTQRTYDNGSLECDRALDRNSHDRNRDAARCRTPAQEPPWRLRPRHQLVEGVGSVTKTTPDTYVKLPIPRRQLNATWSESLTSRRMLLWALLLCYVRSRRVRDLHSAGNQL